MPARSVTPMLSGEGRGQEGEKMNKTAIGFSVFLSLALAAGLSAAAGDQGDGIGTAKFKTADAVTNFSASAVTVPYFRSQFTDPTNGVTYAYNMVGTNP